MLAAIRVSLEFSTSVIVGDSDIFGTSISRSKKHAPLMIDPVAVNQAISPSKRRGGFLVAMRDPELRGIVKQV